MLGSLSFPNPHSDSPANGGYPLPLASGASAERSTSTRSLGQRQHGHRSDHVLFGVAQQREHTAHGDDIAADIDRQVERLIFKLGKAPSHGRVEALVVRRAILLWNDEIE